jgi:DNA-binding transcriptional MerR regulator
VVEKATIEPRSVMPASRSWAPPQLRTGATTVSHAPENAWEQRTGVARSALRYYEELDILQPNDRRSGQRRYDEAAVALVGAILLLREVGFSLNQIRQIMRPASASGSAAWRDVAARKLKDLDDRIEQAEAARSALQHTLAHHNHDVLDCPRFWDAVTNRLQGISLQASHPH